jgi:outer membrane cobalamin receptor
MITVRAATWRGVLIGLLPLAFPHSVRAQTACAAPAPASGEVAQTRWAAPLDRRISLHAREVSLREALDHVAAAGSLRFSYSAELLPLDRRTCISSTWTTVGDALAQLLRGTGAEPVSVGGTQVVLAPRTARAPEAEPLPAPPITVLDRIVVTGATTALARRPLPVALDVIDAAQLARRNVTTLAQALDGAVPGMWVWEQSPSSLVARYGSIRGASSFGVSYPKVYIDGIEVANPLLVTRINPDALDKIEVIRGPQGAALYGADAISGVINIITRKDASRGNGNHAQVSSDVGGVGSVFASTPALTQHHTLSFRSGSNVRSGGFALTGSSIGEFIPGEFARELAGNANVRFIGTRTNIVGTARFSAQSSGAAFSPLLTDSVPQILAAVTPRYRAHAGAPGDSDRPRAPGPWQIMADSVDTQSAQQYTIGTNATFVRNERWTHAAVLGLDGYRMHNVPNADAALPWGADEDRQPANGGADRGTVRLSSVAQFGTPDRTSATLTLAAEHSTLREHLNDPGSHASPSQPGSQPGPSQPAQRGHEQDVLWRSNTGLVGQARAAFGDALFLSGGMRLEHNGGFAADDRIAALPMLGAAFVMDAGSWTLKLRSAYGKGIRPPNSSIRETSWMDVQRSTSSNGLESEVQTGIETGVDVMLGSTFALHVTHFNQRATGLIQQVAMYREPEFGARRGFIYELQNVGEITNRGWELQASVGVGPLFVSGSLAQVDSRVQRAARGYTGDLRAGDRMLAVPARTANLSASWSMSGWFTSLSATRAYDWVNYDRLALAQAFADTEKPVRNLVGFRLREYWRNYDGVTRLRFSAARDLTQRFTIVVSGENLLNRQLGEPDNITVLPGRTVTLGARARF